MENKIMENIQKETADKYQEFFDFMIQEHDLILTKGQIDDIVFEAQRLVEKNNKRSMENDKDVYCVGCGMDEQDGTYKYHRTVANGDEWYCTNCKDYHLH